MRIEDMPRPWLLAAVTGVPMAALLRRAEQENAATPQDVAGDGQERRSDRDRGRSHEHRVVYLPSWQ